MESGKQYPSKVAKVLEYITDNPITVTGHKMYYKSTHNLPTHRGLPTDIMGSIETLDLDSDFGVKNHFG